MNHTIIMSKIYNKNNYQRRREKNNNNVVYFGACNINLIFTIVEVVIIHAL